MIDSLVSYPLLIFDWVLKTTLMASVLVGVILFVKFLLKNKLTPRWHYLLWMILIIRLLLPSSLESPYSIYAILSYGHDFINPLQTNSYDSLIEENAYSIELSGSMVDNKQTIDGSPFSKLASSETNEKQMHHSISFHTIAFYTWLIGVLLFGLMTFWVNHRLYIFLKRQSVNTNQKILGIFLDCRNSVGIRKNIPLLIGGISSPMILGFYRPRIILPKIAMQQLNETQLRHIFYHELAHIKRRDIGVNWLMYSLLILNWFNPILWFAYYCMRNDQELSCDAFALTFMEDGEKISYGHTIISLLEHYSKFYPIPSLANLSRNKKTLKRRIQMIKNFDEKTYRWSALGIIILLSVATISLFNTHSDAAMVETSSSITKDEPSVYIYHTHNLESFLTESKTEDIAMAFDSTNNITLVGNRLRESLKKEGIQSINDETNIMQILGERNLSFSESYKVARKPLEDAVAKNGSIKMVFDIHRDARERNITTVNLHGKEYAKIAFIVSASSSKYDENKEFATILHEALVKKFPQLSRGVRIKDNPSYQNTYNQDLLGNSVLIEIGGAENTLQEEYRSVDVLAEVVSDVLNQN